MQKNPFIHKDSRGILVGFRVPNKQWPLWWTGSGFKDMDRALTAREFEFKTEQEAEDFIKNQALKFIQEWRSDQVNLIMGW